MVGQRGDDLVWSTEVPDDLPDIDALLLVGDSPPPPPKTDPTSVRVRRGEFRGFRSLANVDVDLADLTVLVGANGAGKSNVLDAFFRRPASLGSAPKQRSPETTRSTGSAPSGNRELSGERQADGVWKHTLWSATGTKRTQVPSCATPSLGAAFGPVVKLRLDASRISQPTFATEVRPFVHHDGRNVAAVLADLAATDPERRQAIVDAVRVVVPQVQDVRMPRALVSRVLTETRLIDGRAVDREMRRDELGHRLEAKIAGKWVPADQLSEGILLVIALQTILRGTRPPKLLLIDDIDRAGVGGVAVRDDPGRVLELRRRGLARGWLVKVLLTCEGPSDERWMRMKTFREGEAGQTRLQLQVVRAVVKQRGVDATVLLRDVDRSDDRVEVIRAERASVACGPLAVGTPRQCVESWWVCGVSPSQRGVDDANRDLRKHCLFDPLHEPHRLSHKDGSPRSAKAVWTTLNSLVSEVDAMDHFVTRRGEDSGPMVETLAAAFVRELEVLRVR